jgi:hypothetical protein
MLLFTQEKLILKSVIKVGKENLCAVKRSAGKDFRKKELWLVFVNKGKVRSKGL